MFYVLHGCPIFLYPLHTKDKLHRNTLNVTHITLNLSAPDTKKVIEVQSFMPETSVVSLTVIEHSLLLTAGTACDSYSLARRYI